MAKSYLFYRCGCEEAREPVMIFTADSEEEAREAPTWLREHHPENELLHIGPGEFFEIIQPVLEEDGQLGLCREVGLDFGERIILGDEVEHLTDDELSGLVEKVSVFSKLDPLQKERIVKALRRNGHVVGFLGDGINDAPAQRGIFAKTL